MRVPRTNKLNACRSFYPAAALRLGELLARQGDLGGAERHLAEALRAAPEELRACEELVAVKRPLGKSEEARSHGTGRAGSISAQLFLRGELGQPDLAQLANDPDRVLNLASQYMRLGLYQKALDVLSREYPPPLPIRASRERWHRRIIPWWLISEDIAARNWGNRAEADYTAASKLSPPTFFPTLRKSSRS